MVEVSDDTDALRPESGCRGEAQAFVEDPGSAQIDRRAVFANIGLHRDDVGDAARVEYSCDLPLGDNGHRPDCSEGSHFGSEQLVHGPGESASIGGMSDAGWPGVGVMRYP